jgi:alkylated DNA repair dioxygenase AlkB
MDLFSTADTPRILVDDAEGGVRYWPDVVDADRAQRWFETLRDGAAWQAQRRPMYDRLVDVPRLLASYRIEEWPPKLPLQDMLAIVQAHAPAPYNAVGLNLYRDGRDSVAMHNDKLHTIIPGFPIALISMGDARRMNIRAKNGPGRAVGIDLEHGSLLVMSHASQLTHEHGIPKTVKAVGPRMSAVFRVRPERYAE